ncbi:MAG: hypothetical protein K9G13_04440 [Aquiluna sp.]|nr:hypothetical protein [Aquiluna sp.]MCF8545769.1 hypothetical protein [Aquiluna sp.]
MKLAETLGSWRQETMAELRFLTSRVSELNFLSPQIILFFVSAHMFGFVVYDIALMQASVGALLGTFIASEIAYLVIYVPLFWLLAKASRFKSNLTLKFLIVSCAVSVRALILEIGHWHIGNDASVDFSRVPGDVTAGFISIAFAGYIGISLIRLKAERLEQDSFAESLIDHKRNLKTTTRQIENALVDRAQTQLFGQLAALKISALAARGKSRVSDLANQLQKIIEDEVRPLSRELLQKVEILATPRPSNNPRQIRGWLPKALGPRQDSRIWLSYWISMPNIFVTYWSTINLSSAVLIFFSSLTFPALMRVILSARWAKREMRNWLGVLVLITVSLIAYVPTAIVSMSFLEKDPMVRVLRISGFLVLLVVNIVIAVWNSIERTREATLAKTRVINEEINRELTLAEQEIWLAKRTWSYLIHGTVQGALTVAFSRIQNREKHTSAELKLVADDIQKAIDAIKRGGGLRRNLDELFEDLHQTWDGVCKIELTLNTQARSQLLGRERATACVAEIVKELVGNAVRHGKANTISIAVNMSKHSEIEIRAVNNGSSWTNENPGLGSALFDELTTSWSLSQQKRQTVFSCRIPIETSRVKLQASF